MDDFERELTRMMRDARQQAPFEPAHQRRLYRGIRARRRSRMLWKAGGSALAVTGLSVGLALLPGADSGARPADQRPLPATSPTPPPAAPTPTAPAPSAAARTSPPPDASATADAGTTAPAAGRTTASVPPSATADGSGRTPSPPTPPPSSAPPTAPPSSEPPGEPSVPADHESAGSG